MQAVVTLDVRQDFSAELNFSGEWLIGNIIKNRDTIIAALEKPDFKRLVFNGKQITRWDSQLTAFLAHLIEVCRKNKIDFALNDFPAGVDSLLNLAFAVPMHQEVTKTARQISFLEELGKIVLDFWEKTKDVCLFLHRVNASFARFFSHKAVVRKKDLLLEIQRAGAEAFGIVSLICFLVGLILAFVGSIQLKLFGAQIYVSSLVAISITRVMGAIMAGVIMAGRTGASYAATLGSMQVNEEVDALKTMGISPFDFLVLPRALALSLMMPLLVVYADLMGILGGAFVGLFMLGLSPEDYIRMTMKALLMRNIIIGIVHGAVYGVIIAICGCYQGMNCGRNASAVGAATTSSVVYSIVWMTIATAVLTFIFSVCGV
ncbi:MAG: ABC transporter permease [Alphaproteobacteria bacterium]|nr:ABC transporter permease [Alphaproteobacteria bacterium]MBO4643627.1 ABC transporter permease [Alphaproteobacteria bacterium]